MCARACVREWVYLYVYVQRFSSDYVVNTAFPLLKTFL